MFKLSVDEIISKINDSTQLSPDVIKGRINSKIKELSGLVSEEGAAHIVANELGVELLKISSSGKVDIENLLPGLRNIDMGGTVSKVFPVYTFKKNDSEGKVGSMMVSDGTGEVRVVVWDHRVGLLEKGDIREDTRISVRGAFVKEGKYGMEVHLRSTSDLTFKRQVAKFTPIKDVAGGYVSIRGTVADIPTKNPFFEVCPVCGRRIKAQCPEHGKVKPAYSMVVELSLFDNTGSMRCVCFRNAAESALQTDGKSALDIAMKNNDKSLPIKMAMSNVIGRTAYIHGNSKVNTFTKELEIVVDKIIYPVPDDELTYWREQ